MSERANDQAQTLPEADPGTDAALQAELRRESEEGRHEVGDISENGTLTGSSTWETLDGERKE